MPLLAVCWWQWNVHKNLSHNTILHSHQGLKYPSIKWNYVSANNTMKKKVIDWENKFTSIPGATLLVPLSSNIVRSWELCAQYGCTLRNSDTSGRTCTRLAICRAKRHIFRCENKRIWNFMCSHSHNWMEGESNCMSFE